VNIEDIDSIDALVRDPRIRQIAKDMLKQYSGTLRPEKLVPYCLALLGRQPGAQEQYAAAFRRTQDVGRQLDAVAHGHQHIALFMKHHGHKISRHGRH
jgi:hypothetical protein